MYHKGEGVAKDPGAAVAQYLVSAGGGEPRAAYVLGCMYCMGDTVEEDLGTGGAVVRTVCCLGVTPLPSFRSEPCFPAGPTSGAIRTRP